MKEGSVASLRKAGLTLAFLLGAVLLAAGCGGAGASQSKELSLGYIEWDENVANSNLVKVLLEDELEYDEVELLLTDLGPMFEGLAGGRLDAFLDAWMPGHQSFVDEVEDEVELSEEPWYLGETQYGIAVPDYMDARSIEDLDDAEVSEINGIEPGALLMERIEDNVIPEYGLEADLVEASTPAMLGAVDAAYQQEEPIAFLAWAPHWMNTKYDFHYLEDPQDAMGELTDPSQLHSVMRVDLSEDDPVAYALINAMKLDEDHIGTLELAINDAENPAEGARTWLEEEENRRVVDPWLEAVEEAQQE